MLTQEQAEQHVLEALTQRKRADGGVPLLSLRVRQRTERPFGWAFLCTPLCEEDDDPTDNVTSASQLVLINKYTGQMLTASIDQFVQQCIETYEAGLLSQGEAWCLTLDAPWRGWGRAKRKRRTSQQRLASLGLRELSKEQN